MNKAQTVIEYFIIATVLLGVILSSGVIERFRNSFQGYFDTAVEQMK